MLQENVCRKKFMVIKNSSRNRWSRLPPQISASEKAVIIGKIKKDTLYKVSFSIKFILNISKRYLERS